MEFQIGDWVIWHLYSGNTVYARIGDKDLKQYRYYVPGNQTSWWKSKLTAIRKMTDAEIMEFVLEQ